MVQFRSSAGLKIQGETATTKIVPTVLFGRVVTMDDARRVIDDGEIGVAGKSIVYVGPRGAKRPPEMNGALEVETKGTIYPGLIELHNHPAYNATPLWDVPKLFKNRSEWRDHSSEYVRKVKFATYLIGKNQLDVDYPRAVARFVECKALFGAQTTYAGISKSDGSNYLGMVRNVEFPNEAGWPAAIGWINDFKSAADAEETINPILGDRTKPRLLHLSEGTDADARKVFYYLQRGNGTWLLAANILTIHGLGLNLEDFEPLAQSGGLVWSPLSNLLLYGETAKVAAAKAAGVRLALGADWAPSGSKNLLGELKIARIVSEHQGGIFSDRELIEMVTCSPAKMMGWENWVGSIKEGMRADIAVISGTEKDAYAQMIEATEEDVIAVFIDGRARCGRSDLIDPHSPGAESFQIGKSTFIIDLAELNTDPLAGFGLSAAVNKLSYGFGHLPELAKLRNEYKVPELIRTSPFTLHLEMDETRASGILPASPEPVILPGDVDRMALEPITGVDDAGFLFRIRASPNVPDWLKASLQI